MCGVPEEKFDILRRRRGLANRDKFDLDEFLALMGFAPSGMRGDVIVGQGGDVASGASGAIPQILIDEENGDGRMLSGGLNASQKLLASALKGHGGLSTIRSPVMARRFDMSFANDVAVDGVGGSAAATTTSARRKPKKKQRAFMFKRSNEKDGRQTASPDPGAGRV